MTVHLQKGFWLIWGVPGKQGPTEVVYITEEELRAAEEEEPLDNFPAWQHDAIRIANDLLETDHYLPLPTKFDIHKYRIMERFCYAVDDEDRRDALCNAIRGRGAFRYFKDKIHEYGIAEFPLDTHHNERMVWPSRFATSD